MLYLSMQRRGKLLYEGITYGRLSNKELMNVIMPRCLGLLPERLPTIVRLEVGYQQLL